jgi:hypothetical protein
MPNRLRLHFVLYEPSSELGMAPATYRPYLLVSGPWQTPGSGVATIVPLHSGIPVPDQVHFVAESGGPQAALRMARDAVLELRQNRGLRTMPSTLEEFEQW